MSVSLMRVGNRERAGLTYEVRPWRFHRHRGTGPYRRRPAGRRRRGALTEALQRMGGERARLHQKCLCPRRRVLAGVRWHGPPARTTFMLVPPCGLFGDWAT